MTRWHTSAKEQTKQPNSTLSRNAATLKEETRGRKLPNQPRNRLAQSRNLFVNGLSTQ